MVPELAHRQFDKYGKLADGIKEELPSTNRIAKTLRWGCGSRAISRRAWVPGYRGRLGTSSAIPMNAPQRALRICCICPKLYRRRWLNWGALPSPHPRNRNTLRSRYRDRQLQQNKYFLADFNLYRRYNGGRPGNIAACAPVGSHSSTLKPLIANMHSDAGYA